MQNSATQIDLVKRVETADRMRFIVVYDVE